MVKVIDNARFNKTALLGHHIDDAQNLERPGDDHAKAAHLVWLALRNTAARDHANDLKGDNGQPGYGLAGMGVSQALELLWPGIGKQERGRARMAIVRHLKESGNVITLEQNRAYKQGLTWIAADWTEIKSNRRLKSYSPDNRKARAEHSAMKELVELTEDMELYATHNGVTVTEAKEKVSAKVTPAIVCEDIERMAKGAAEDFAETGPVVEYDAGGPINASHVGDNLFFQTERLNYFAMVPPELIEVFNQLRRIYSQPTEELEVLRKENAELKRRLNAFKEAISGLE